MLVTAEDYLNNLPQSTTSIDLSETATSTSPDKKHQLPDQLSAAKFARTITSFTLRGKRLDNLQPLGRLASLKRLIIINCDLSRAKASLDTVFSTLPNLQFLNLSNTRLTEVPASIAQLRYVRTHLQPYTHCTHNFTTHTQFNL